jgi:putative membrane protein
VTGIAPTPGAVEDYEGPDPGMAAERTDLAWSRSGLAIGACGVVVLKGLPAVTGNPSAPVAGAAILVLGVLTWGLGRWSAGQRREAPGRPRPPARRRDLAPAAYGTAGVGLAALVLILLRAG